MAGEAWQLEYKEAGCIASSSSKHREVNVSVQLTSSFLFNQGSSLRNGAAHSESSLHNGAALSGSSLYNGAAHSELQPT